jgi:hypothetical protein
MAEHTFDILSKVVDETKGPKNWTFRLFNDNEGSTPPILRLFITVKGYNNYKQDEQFIVTHVQPVPHTTYNEKSWRRWIFEQCQRVMVHELGECVRFGPDEERPFAPMHGPGEDPYTLHEWRSEEDALTTQDGSIRKGPV